MAVDKVPRKEFSGEFVLWCEGGCVPDELVGGADDWTSG